MTFKQTLSVTALSVSLCASMGSASAASQLGNVKSVQATRSGNTVSVLWSQVPGAVSYRIYFSHESILNNGGNYDDFEQTTDAQTLYVFSQLPLTSPKIYIGVLAVDADNNESEGFEVESIMENGPSPSVIEIPALPQSSQSSVSTMPNSDSSLTTATPMGIVSIEAESETGVLLTFSKEVSSKAAVNPNSFLITTVSGTALQIQKVIVSGKIILLTTERQTANTEYILKLLSIIMATDGTNATPSEPPVRFEATSDNALPATTNQNPPPSYGKNPSLPAIIIPPTSPQPSAKPSDALPASGIGFLGIAAVAGVVAMRRAQRRKAKIV